MSMSSQHTSKLTHRCVRGRFGHESLSIIVAPHNSAKCSRPRLRNMLPAYFLRLSNPPRRIQKILPKQDSLCAEMEVVRTLSLV